MREIRINDLFSRIADTLNQEERMTEEAFDALAFLRGEVARTVVGTDRIPVESKGIHSFFMSVHDTLLENGTMTDAAYKAINILSRALQDHVAWHADGLDIVYLDGSIVRMNRYAAIGHA